MIFRTKWPQQLSKDKEVKSLKTISVYIYIYMFILKDKYPNFEEGLKCIIMVF